MLEPPFQLRRPRRLLGVPGPRRMGSRLAGVALVALVLLVAPHGGRALAQVYEQVLPRNVIRLTIGQQLIDIGHAPTLRPGSASIQGVLQPGAEDVTLALFRTGARATPSPDDPPPQLIEELELPVDPGSGEFAAEIDTTLDPGAYALYVNSALAGVFTVEAPIAAAASPSSSPLSGLSPTTALAVGVLLSIALGAASLFMQLLRQRD